MEKPCAQPKTVAEIALYQGADREKMLIEGAKKEGQLTLYTVHTWIASQVPKEFEKKYPFIKVSAWRSESGTLLKRVTEEYTAKRFLVDVIGSTSPAPEILRREGILQEFYSPETQYCRDELKGKAKTGVYYLGHRESYNSLAFNTKLIPPAEAPKNMMDLLDPKWKARISIPGSSTGIRWVGSCLEAMGRDFMEKMGRQEVKVQNLSGAAMTGLVVSGEVPLSPCLSDSNVFEAKQKGAPVEWRALEPVVTNIDYSGVVARAPHPHAALLFIDYIHSKEGQKVLMQGGLSPTRTDIESLAKSFTRIVFEAKYSVEEYEKRYDEWQTLMQRLFVRK